MLSLLTTLSDDLIGTMQGMMERAESLCLCSAYGSYEAFKLLRGDFDGLLRRGGQVRCLFDLEQRFTAPDLIREFCTIPGDSECRVSFRGQRDAGDPLLHGRLHAKLYLADGRTDSQLLVGSSNFTRGGFRRNIECNLLLSAKKNDDVISSAREFFWRLWYAPTALRPEDHEGIIDAYEALYAKASSVQSSIVGDKDYQKIVQLFGDAAKQSHLDPNPDSSYLLGLIAGGGYLEPDGGLGIRYHKGVFNRGTSYEGLIHSPGISDIKLRQVSALRRDVRGIQDRLNGYFRQIGSRDRVTVHREGPYDYRLSIRFTGASSLKSIVESYLGQCNIVRRRVVPVVPQSVLSGKSPTIVASFLRGYADIRGRISHTDREGGSGPLRIALSVSTGAEQFAADVEKLLKSVLGLKRVNVLAGNRRSRETMIRIDPVEVSRLRPQKLFSINWKQLLLADFAEYNQREYPMRYKTAEDLGQGRLI